MGKLSVQYGRFRQASRLKPTSSVSAQPIGADRVRGTRQSRSVGEGPTIEEVEDDYEARARSVSAMRAGRDQRKRQASDDPAVVSVSAEPIGVIRVQEGEGNQKAWGEGPTIKEVENDCEARARSLPPNEPVETTENVKLRTTQQLSVQVRKTIGANRVRGTRQTKSMRGKPNDSKSRGRL
jgi:hypothetical protein